MIFRERQSLRVMQLRQHYLLATVKPTSMTTSFSITSFVQQVTDKMSNATRMRIVRRIESIVIRPMETLA